MRRLAPWAPLRLERRAGRRISVRPAELLNGGYDLADPGRRAVLGAIVLL
ncbi:MAG: hypothetical protein AABM42_05055 [Actinomycetota bacterium]